MSAPKKKPTRKRGRADDAVDNNGPSGQQQQQQQQGSVGPQSAEQPAALQFFRTGAHRAAVRGYPDHFDSIAQFAEETGRLIRVDDEWVSMLHGEGTPDLEAVRKKLMFLMSSRPADAINCVQLQQEVHTRVAHGAGLVATDVPMGYFPGPMARPLTTSRSRLLHENGQYWVTEKSDGLRTMMYAKHTKHIPRWYLACGEGWILMPFSDSIVCERAALACVTSKRTSSANMVSYLSFFTKGEQEKLCLSVRATKGDAVQDMRNSAFSLTNPDNEMAIALRRVEGEGYGLAYFFDRSFQPHLLVEEVVFPGYEVLFDGELIFNLARKRIEYITYDLPCVSTMIGRTLAQGPLEFRLGSAPMSIRVQKMRELCRLRRNHIEALEAKSKIRTNAYVSVRVKEFYPMADIKTVIDKITRDQSGKYIYNQETYNDGIIFTPEEGEHVRFRPGTCEGLMKYKFVDTQTVDWRVFTTGEECAGGGRLFSLEYVVKDKGPDKVWFEEHITFKKTRLKVKAGLPKLEDRVPYIAECDFLPTKGLWRVLNIRKDKTTANAFTTAGSVLESVSEDINEATIERICGEAVARIKTKEPTVFKYPKHASPDDYNTKRFTVPYVSFILRTHYNRIKDEKRLSMQVRARLPQFDRPRSFSYSTVDEAFGFGCAPLAVDKTSLLQHLMFMEVANRGGCMHWSDCVVRAVFDPEVGRWDIFEVVMNANNYANKEPATINNLLTHLEETAMYGKSTYKEEQDQTFLQSTVCKVRKALVGSDSHYANKSLDQNLDDNRSSLRAFNNWLKNTIIETVSARVEPLHSCIERTLLVLDLCSGRGGDLHKWGRLKPLFYVAVDSCIEAVGIAAKRYSSNALSVNTKEMYPGMPAHFSCADAFASETHTKLLSTLRSSLEAKYNILRVKNKKMTKNLVNDFTSQNEAKHALFSCVSCQFSFHYSFSLRSKAEITVSDIARSLKVGGIFFGSIVNSHELLKRYKKQAAFTPAGEKVSFGNSFYRVDCGNEFPSPDTIDDEGRLLSTPAKSYGVEYDFSLENCVEKETEYMIFWDAFVEMCAKHSLSLVEELSQPFLEIFRTFSTQSEHILGWEKQFQRQQHPSAKRRKVATGTSFFF